MNIYDEYETPMVVDLGAIEDMTQEEGDGAKAEEFNDTMVWDN